MDSARLSGLHGGADPQSEERYRVLFESAPVGIAISEANGVIVHTNPALQKMLGRTDQELRGSTLRNFRPTGTPTREFATLHQLARDRAGTVRHTRQLMHSNGDVLWLQVTACAVPSETGEVEQIYRMFENVTQQKRAEEALRQSEERNLKRTRHLASIGELAAGVAHEINNPLAGLLGLTQLLMRQGLPSKVQQDLEIIYAEGRRAARIVENLLLFARDSEPMAQAVDLRTVIDRACQLKTYDLRRHSVELRTEGPPTLPLILGDEQRLIEVMLNVITNAEQAISGTGRPGAITVRCAADDNRVRVSVSDDGPGMPSQILGKIFEPFFTTKEVGVGTGLGLSVCQGIIHQHHGEMWAESELGDGATVHLEFPVPIAPLERMSSPTFQRLAASGMRILVVEDEPTVREFMARVLDIDGHEVRTAADGEDAWAQLQSARFDCVVADLRMPRMGGQELHRLALEMDPDVAGRFIFVTGDTVSSETAEFLSSTTNRSLRKPIDADELSLRVAELQDLDESHD